MSANRFTETANVIPMRTETALSDGSAVLIDKRSAEIRDPEGRLLVRYRDGVLELSATGDVTIAAPEGRVTLEGREVRVRTERYELEASQVIERAHDVFQEVRGLLSTRVGRWRAVVRDALSTRARTTSIVSDEETAVDGKRVLLG